MGPLGVVGTGLMGQGIAQVAAQAGIEVRMLDAREGAAQRARGAIVAQFDRLVQKVRMTAEAAREAGARLVPVASVAELAGCEVVIEAIVEDLEAKRALFAALEPVVGDRALLATNTSSLPVTAIAAACRHPGRVGGFHFFSPVPLMKVVEVIAGARTEPWVADALVALARRFGHEPVRASDTPGFLVNHAGRGYGTEALRVVSEGVADFAAIDDILREGAGFRMGPFELMDLTGLDVSQPVMDSIYHQFYEEPRFRPSPLLAQRKAAGLLGRKAGQGFYRYENGERVAPPAADAPAARPASVWVSRRDARAHATVCGLVEKLGVRLDGGERPAPESLCVVTPWASDATTAVVSEGLEAARSVAIDAEFGLATRRTVMFTPLTSEASREAARGLFGADGVPVSAIRDSVGFVAPRVVAHIVNVACEIAQARIATPEDIDRAVTLGLGYRRGPLAMGDALGATRVLSLLEGMLAFYGDPRYRPSAWLMRRAMLGVPLSTPEP